MASVLLDVLLEEVRPYGRLREPLGGAFRLGLLPGGRRADVGGDDDRTVRAAERLQGSLALILRLVAVDAERLDLVRAQGWCFLVAGGTYVHPNM